MQDVIRLIKKLYLTTQQYLIQKPVSLAKTSTSNPATLNKTCLFKIQYVSHNIAGDNTTLIYLVAASNAEVAMFNVTSSNVRSMTAWCLFSRY